ncbi:DNA methyltransferase [Gracilimonas sp. Q87]|uniref:DNA methyltransferase n=1 Tax=Gracilimonas sp. Q87 TaxID=3384766 RepID=UPI003984386B
MNIAQIEENLKDLIADYDKDEFIYDLLLAYGLPKASITRLKKGSYDMSDNEDDNTVSWKKRVYYRVEHQKDLHTTLMDLADQVKHDQRFIVATDFKTLLARDVKTKENLDIPIEDLPKNYDFFLPWAGMEKTAHQNENPADVKAAEKMAKLFDEIKKDNPADDPGFIHEMNVFLSRLLFSFFAEDTNIFADGQFTNGIASHTQVDGSDLDTYLNKLFATLNTKKNDRKGLPAYLNEFPYVNGGLFKDEIESPKFTRRSRQAIIDSGELDWSAINPDIFGSMMQAVITPEHRGGLGMHYTSVPNIMKVIKPLFLDDLYEDFDKGHNQPRKLIKLLDRISQIKIFDPACGSGNFLIIAYKELRRLEMKIIRRLIELKKLAVGFKAKEEQHSIIPESQLDLAESYEVELFSRIQLTQFYGIELDDFAHEIAQLSLWLAEHQMNVEFYEEFGRMNPTLPLKQAGKIVHGNACRIDWERVCPKEINEQVYLIGNPPYLGARNQGESHKADMDIVFRNYENYKDLDYISCWFLKGSQYIKNSKSALAFVSTNSISQGDQVSLLWTKIFEADVEIQFAYPSFKWTNNAKKNAGVTVVIIGLLPPGIRKDKFLISDNHYHKVETINAYLVNGPKTIVKKRREPISNFPEMSFGNMPNDGGGLIFSKEEKNNLLAKQPEANNFIKKYVGASEFIRGNERFCLWIEDSDLDQIGRFPIIQDRIEVTRKHRENSKDSGTNKLAERSHQFRDTNTPSESQIIVPSVSSERREYIPTGFLGTETIISNSAQVIYDPEPWILGVITSKIHMCWVRAVAGRLKTDYRYSKQIVYNTFPFPNISDQRKQEITQCVFRILDVREQYPSKTLAELYDPEKMPYSLKEAHQANDDVIDKCYRYRPFESDEKRLEYLFKQYEEMIEAEKTKA